MRAKGYFSILIIILVALGLRPAQDSAPNQQIVLQFNENEITNDGAESALANVKQQLLDAGAYNIRVESSQSGKLKITYYSKFNVEYIKGLLSKDALGYATQNESEDKIPSNNNYDLDIIEIQNGGDTGSGFDDFFIPSPNQKYDSSPNLKVLISIAISEDDINNLVKVAFKVNSNVTNGLDNTSYEIPEVRAGPKA